MANTITVVSDTPTAKPGLVTAELGTSWTLLWEPSNYRAPNPDAGGALRFRAGYSEVTSRINFCNKASLLRTVSLRIVRASGAISMLVNAFAVENNDMFPFEANGLVLMCNGLTLNAVGDRLEGMASVTASVDVSFSIVSGEAEVDDV